MVANKKREIKLDEIMEEIRIMKVEVLGNV
jgi:hypothetical protein